MKLIKQIKRFNTVVESLKESQIHIFEKLLGCGLFLQSLHIIKTGQWCEMQESHIKYACNKCTIIW